MALNLVVFVTTTDIRQHKQTDKQTVTDRQTDRVHKNKKTT